MHEHTSVDPAPARLGEANGLLQDDAVTVVDVPAFTELVGDALTVGLNSALHTASDNPRLTQQSLLSRAYTFVRTPVRALVPCARRA